MPRTINAFYSGFPAILEFVLFPYPFFLLLFRNRLYTLEKDIVLHHKYSEQWFTFKLYMIFLGLLKRDQGVRTQKHYGAIFREISCENTKNEDWGSV